MKNRLYYILFLFYFFILGFILYLNGVFTGEITSYENLIINLGFLLLIGILFLRSAASFSRLNQSTAALRLASQTLLAEYEKKNGSLWEDYKERSDVFHNSVLDTAFDRYRKRMKAYTGQNAAAADIDIESCINEELFDRIAMTHFNSNIPGTLTGLGILGTFIGLSLGLGAFSGNDIFTISDNVGPLLTGMKVAFHTSVYGIFFSLVFNFIYRNIMAQAYADLSEFLSCFRECVTSPAAPCADDNTKAMLIYQANAANSLKSILNYLKGASAEQTLAVEQMVSEFSRQLTRSMGADFDRLGKALHETAEAQSIHTRNYHSMETVAKELLEANHSLQQLLEQTIDRQEQFARQLNRQSVQITEACDTINTDIANQLYTFHQMGDLYEK